MVSSWIFCVDDVRMSNDLFIRPRAIEYKLYYPSIHQS